MIENLLTIWGFITLYGLFHPKSTPHKLLCNPPSFLIFQSTPSTYFIYVHFEIFYILKIQFLFNFFLDNEKGAHINKTSTPSCVDIFFRVEQPLVIVAFCIDLFSFQVCICLFPVRSSSEGDA